MKVEIAEPRTEQELEEYYRLRYERLRAPHGQPPGSERDNPAEASSTHLIAKVDGRVVGAACWAVGMGRDELTGKRKIFVRSRQLAVDPEFEGRGVGIVLMRHVERGARNVGAEEIVGNVRLELIPYFESLGWFVSGQGETLFGSVEHVSMVKPL